MPSPLNLAKKISGPEEATVLMYVRAYTPPPPPSLTHTHTHTRTRAHTHSSCWQETRHVLHQNTHTLAHPTGAARKLPHSTHSCGGWWHEAYSHLTAWPWKESVELCNRFNSTRLSQHSEADSCCSESQHPVNSLVYLLMNYYD